MVPVPEQKKNKKLSLFTITLILGFIIESALILSTTNSCSPFWANPLVIIIIVSILWVLAYFVAERNMEAALILFFKYVGIWIFVAFVYLLTPLSPFCTTTPLSGPVCASAPGFLCQNPTLSQNGTLSFMFGMELSNQKYYNIQMACAATANTGGYPNNAQALVNINPSGIAKGNIPGDSNNIALASGETVLVSNLLCYGSTGLPLGSISNPASIGSPFSGFIWLDYTNSSGIPNSINPWQTQKIAIVLVKVT